MARQSRQATPQYKDIRSVHLAKVIKCVLPSRIRKPNYVLRVVTSITKTCIQRSSYTRAIEVKSLIKQVERFSAAVNMSCSGAVRCTRRVLSSLEHREYLVMEENGTFTLTSDCIDILKKACATVDDLRPPSTLEGSIRFCGYIKHTILLKPLSQTELKSHVRDLEIYVEAQDKIITGNQEERDALLSENASYKKKFGPLDGPCYSELPSADPKGKNVTRERLHIDTNALNDCTRGGEGSTSHAYTTPGRVHSSGQHAYPTPVSIPQPRLDSSRTLSIMEEPPSPTPLSHKGSATALSRSGSFASTCHVPMPELFEETIITRMNPSLFSTTAEITRFNNELKCSQEEVARIQDQHTKQIWDHQSTIVDLTQRLAFTEQERDENKQDLLRAFAALEQEQDRRIALEQNLTREISEKEQELQEAWDKNEVQAALLSQERTVSLQISIEISGLQDALDRLRKDCSQLQSSRARLEVQVQEARSQAHRAKQQREEDARSYRATVKQYNLRHAAEAKVAKSSQLHAHKDRRQVYKMRKHGILEKEKREKDHATQLRETEEANRLKVDQLKRSNARAMMHVMQAGAALQEGFYGL